MTGEELKEKYAKIHQGDCNYCEKDDNPSTRLGYCCDYGGDNNRFVCNFDTKEFRDFVAAEGGVITPKPLTMEELVKYFNEAARSGKVYFEDISTHLWVAPGAILDLSVLLDLINNKQKEG